VIDHALGPEVDGLDPLERDLVLLGRSLSVAPPPAGLGERVLACIETEGHGVRLRRFAASIAAAVVLVIALVPPVRASVLELLRIGGVSVREVPAPPTLGGPTPSGSSATAVPYASLAQAERATGLSVPTPPSLGEPTMVAVAHDGRVVEVTWADRAGPSADVRMDAFTGGLDWGYLKTVWQEVTPTIVAGRDALWFAGAHDLAWIDRSGARQSSPPRRAGPTLVWVDTFPDGRVVTYRLEGLKTLAAALALAQTTLPTQR